MPTSVITGRAGFLGPHGALRLLLGLAAALAWDPLAGRFERR